MTDNVIPIDDATSDDLPKYVRIGHRTYKIEILSEITRRSEGFDGQHLADIHLIRVAMDLKPSERAMILLHEILHAVWAAAFLDEAKDITEEQICHAFGNVLTQIWQDNPEVMNWIGENARG